MAKRHPTAERVREALTYEPETGLFRWRIRAAYRTHVGDVAGSVSKSDGYVTIQLDKTLHYAHVLAWLWMTGEPPEKGLDHRDGVRSNNRWSNLRLATRGQNMHNIIAPMKNNGLGLRGVTQIKGYERFRARIMVDNKMVHIGNFDTAEEAAAAYLEAKQQLHPFCER